MSPTPLPRRPLLAALLALSTGCLPRPHQRQPAAPEPAFDPIRFFAGHTRGEGTLDVRIGADRTLRVASVGRAEPDGTLRLDQTVTYDDGTVESRVWRLRRVDATRYEAELSNGRGIVRAEVKGNRFHLRYPIRRPAVYMEQWLYLAPDRRSVRNLAQVTVLGVPWASLEETITRTDGSAAAST